MTSSLFTRRAALSAAIAAALTPVAYASAVAPLSADDQTLVDQAAAYLQNLGEIKGRFEQTDWRGTISRGDLFLARPGRARFAYDPPSNLLMISDGRRVWVADPRLKTVSHYPLSATPLSLFLARNVHFDRDVTITEVRRYSDGFAISLRATRHPTRGEITLTFAEAPLHLTEWRMVDGQGRATRIVLSALESAPGLDPKLFKAPDSGVDRRETAP